MLTEVIIRSGTFFCCAEAEAMILGIHICCFFGLDFNMTELQHNVFCWTFAAMYSFMFFFSNLLHLNRSQFSGASETKKHDIFGQDTTFGQGKVHKRAR